VKLSFWLDALITYHSAEDKDEEEYKIFDKKIDQNKSFFFHVYGKFNWTKRQHGQQLSVNVKILEHLRNSTDWRISK
jgi:hypothetical protein